MGRMHHTNLISRVLSHPWPVQPLSLSLPAQGWVGETQGPRLAPCALGVLHWCGHAHSQNPSDMGIPCNRNPNPNPNSWGNTRDAHITRVLGKRMPKTRRCSYHCDWGTFAFHISSMFPCALRLRLFSGTQQFNGISDSRVACSRLSDSGGRRERKRHAKSWRGGKKEKERSCRTFSPQFPPVLFLCLRFLNSADPTISEPGTG